ncbi:unnamed protein product, partial [Prunus armeniaca]
WSAINRISQRGRISSSSRLSSLPCVARKWL